MKMKALVTGGAGFLGSNLVAYLLAQGDWEVTVLDDFFTGLDANIEPWRERVRIVRGSVLDLELVRELSQGVEVIWHLAARNIIASSTNPRGDLDANIIGTYNVLQCARETQVRQMVYTSTSSVYGNARRLPINEDDGLDFLNFYSVSKYAAEGYARVFYEAYDLPVAIVRYSNVYGPWQHPSNPYCGVIGKFVLAALKGESLRIHGDGEQTRDFTYVDDAIEATYRAGTNPRAVGHIYNIGTGRETTVNQLAQTILEVTGNNSPIVHVESRDIDNIRRRVVSIERIRHDLKFFPKVVLSAGIARTIEWFKQSSLAE